MPLIMLVFTLYMSLKEEQDLAIVAAAFCIMKTMEYSLRGVSNEMTFASLDYESRYVAKQEIALLANRFSKSFTAVTLSLLTKYVAYTTLQDILSWTASILAGFWLITSYQLTTIIFARDKPKVA
jgi:ATP/ADP translocase